MQRTTTGNHGAVLPDASSNLSKKEQVAEMFDDIAGRYDFLNHLLSMGIDKGWRKKAIKSIAAIQPKIILDVATGTADLAIAAAKALPEAQIIGVDISEGMLEVGRKKLKSSHPDKNIELLTGDSEHLPFNDNHFDAITCAYGVRNFQNLEAGLADMHRVLRPGGKIAILEFSHPKAFPVKQFYQFYFRYILPTMGRLVSKNSHAYTYLPASVKAFPEGAIFCETLTCCGFKDATARPLTFGITTLYTASR